MQGRRTGRLLLCGIALTAPFLLAYADRDRLQHALASGLGGGRVRMREHHLDPREQRAHLAPQPRERAHAHGRGPTPAARDARSGGERGGGEAVRRVERRGAQLARVGRVEQPALL
jgi:hypothetical protein